METLRTEIVIEVPDEFRDRWLDLMGLTNTPENIKSLLNLACEAIEDGHRSITDEIFYKIERTE